MEEQRIPNLVIKKSNWLGHIVYWLIAAILLFFVFSNRNYDFNIRILLVSYIIVISYIVTYFANKFLITKFLFNGKILMFSYLVLGIFIVTVWLVTYSTFLILVYSMAYSPNIILPNKDDIIILLSGSFLIIISAAVIHFIKESYRRFNEKMDIEKQKQLTEIKLKEANLKLLQGQIHPHFLFNMLNNLYGMVNESVDYSRTIIMKLSDLLDYMLYECDKPFVDLQKEIEFIENYIELERVRHDENFNVTLNYPMFDRKISIAPLILFPFVENAFKHGFNKPANNFIKIEIELLEYDLIFKITNSLSEFKNDKYLKQEGKGIGLKNIQDRLDLIYKDRYSLDISDNEKEYSVKLNLKLNESSK